MRNVHEAVKVLIDREGLVIADELDIHICRIIQCRTVPLRQLPRAGYVVRIHIQIHYRFLLLHA